ncbi:Oidioi.mRNA.OKI2018_I69.chr1.g3805.t1.cds [Oikopleura dioica]|uniref:Oidioi.mRNA.OKI2018_I69.chr1.g3805.t1.cds n=1 Tax=Oikopleura dioica TaxID=34765 RepID=A0ABN7SV64_OIKDI|nr:Oidioi.mRNA.OKI2018_I69.chr1.g3805.t1.cds [Oikopleura dioica]
METEITQSMRALAAQKWTATTMRYPHHTEKELVLAFFLTLELGSEVRGSMNIIAFGKALRDEVLQRVNTARLVVIHQSNRWVRRALLSRDDLDATIEDMDAEGPRENENEGEPETGA